MKQIQIGALTYSVSERVDLHTTSQDGHKVVLNGHITYSDQQIRLASELGAEMKLCVLLHECAHGILDQSGQDMPESALVALGYGLYGLIRNNPLLVAAVQRGRLQDDQPTAD